MSLKNNVFIENFWDKNILPTLMEYIKIPNKSPHFDKSWAIHGYMDQAIKLVSTWCEENAIPKMSLEVITLPGRTPVLFIEVKGESENTVLLYGHLDKQPEMTGWDNDLHPFRPVLRGEKLFGRGSADDGYAVFASLTALKFLHQSNIPHGRCIILIECCEESGSYDLPYYIDALKTKIGEPSLVICLDSGCGNYNQLWATTSLRGLVSATLSIEMLKQGIHSGLGSGIVPSVFRILRLLLNRIEDPETGDMILKELYVDIPLDRKKQATDAAQILGQAFTEEYPLIEGAETDVKDLTQLILRRTWYPALSVTGCLGLPLIENAGNVTLPNLSVKLSIRIPPSCSEEKAAKCLKDVLEKDPPYRARVTCVIDDMGPGWNAPNLAPWLSKSLNQASLDYFGKEAAYFGEGGSIPFMGMLGKKFKNAQFLITGLLGPHSNAHGPNEFLHVPTAKKLTAIIAKVIQDHHVNAS